MEGRQGGYCSEQRWDKGGGNGGETHSGMLLVYPPTQAGVFPSLRAIYIWRLGPPQTDDRTDVLDFEYNSMSTFPTSAGNGGKYLAPPVAVRARSFQLSAVLYVQLVCLGHDKFICWCHVPIPGFRPAYSRHFVPSKVGAKVEPDMLDRRCLRSRSRTSHQ